jgi:hypothetical protein
MFGQHLNFAGAILGCAMCFLIAEHSFKTWLLYINSGLQAYVFILTPGCPSTYSPRGTGRCAGATRRQRI